MSLVRRVSSPRSRRPPPGYRVYAVGDLHGRIDLLDTMLAAIDAHDRASPRQQSIELFIGDYVDRGPASAAVIERLAADPPPSRQRVCLAGNHEMEMRRFLDNPAAFEDWRSIGGIDTLASYGLPRRLLLDRSQARRIRREFALKVPAHHRAFLERLWLYYECGDYLFVHAGLRPGVAIDAQRERDLLWIREEFLKSGYDFGRTVVHGHTPAQDVELTDVRINVDTGAYATGRLSCVVLEEDRVDVLQVGHRRRAPLLAG